MGRDFVIREVAERLVDLLEASSRVEQCRQDLTGELLPFRIRQGQDLFGERSDPGCVHCWTSYVDRISAPSQYFLINPLIC